ncbi:ABC transporter ATP-binding protein [Lysinibacillus yapensis]|uniref:ABC transporter ATP-binding protein n=1 Tax=Ureibacillus yapensis TaxID=2304605 RepID=A0A396SAR1_9BACL|nr:ABC transporter ATP-binding protein [Lysinibacillus yapensis]RHW38414.1 ABC transporter ATP-binding protein [Lysinibacillus yapensis]
MIRLHNVSVAKNGKDILNNINWEVKKGEHWAILGLNGSGKTTLLNLLNGYLHPISGEVEVFGEVFGNTYIPDLRKKIGFVSSSLEAQFQAFESVLGMVLSGKFASIGLWEEVERTDVELAQNRMKLLRCDHLQDAEFGVLSQGERQRVLIARALMAEPKLLILDEPCNGLDLIAREELLKTIDQLSKEKECPTMVYVTHHVEEILPCFTHTLLLKSGEAFAQGHSVSLLNEETLSRFYERPVSVRLEQNRTLIALKDPIELK